MAHVIQRFDSFQEASELARSLAKRYEVTVRLERSESGWAVVSDTRLIAKAIDERDFDSLEGVVREQDAEIAALKQQISTLKDKLDQVETEKERFRKRVILHEAKDSATVAESFTRSHTRIRTQTETCEACGAPLNLCRCSA